MVTVASDEPRPAIHGRARRGWPGAGPGIVRWPRHSVTVAAAAGGPEGTRSSASDVSRHSASDRDGSRFQISDTGMVITVASLRVAALRRGSRSWVIPCRVLTDCHGTTRCYHPMIIFPFMNSMWPEGCWSHCHSQKISLAESSWNSPLRLHH